MAGTSQRERRPEAIGVSAAGATPQSSAIFHNRDLFSGYYLGTLLAGEIRTRQGETGARMPIRARTRLTRVWGDVSQRFGASTGYPRTRQTWLEPLLTTLGYEPLDEARADDFGAENLPSGIFLYHPPLPLVGDLAAPAAPIQAALDLAPAPTGDTALPADDLAEDAWALPDADEVDDADDERLDGDGDESTESVSAEIADDTPVAPTAVLLALLGWGDDFDRPYASARRRNETPHQLAERLLANGPAQWGLLLNGQRLRLLRRDVNAGRQHYLEVDFDALFEQGTDRDFDTLWALLHAQSFAPGADGRSLLDVIDEQSRKHAEGVSATLKTSVFAAMEAIMTALVARAQEELRAAETPNETDAIDVTGVLNTTEMMGAMGATPTARQRAAAEALADLKGLYEQSLTLLYRLLFILYAESRDLLPVDNPIYRDSYSLEPLRDEIERPDADYQPDSFRLWETLAALFRLWETLAALFRLIHRGCRTTDLVVPAYNGQLFTPASTRLVNVLRIPDSALAAALRDLSMTPATKARGRERISYRDLDVEQLGAVYEGLLEYEPRVAVEPMVEVRYKAAVAVIPARERRDYPALREFAVGAFYLGRGAGRKTTGSYYTPQPLVDFLVRRTLDPLVQGRSAAQILELKIVDPAMGSGAFLVGACHYLAAAYAKALRREEVADHAGLRAVADASPDAGDAALDADLADPNADPDGSDLSDEAARPYRRLVAERCLYGVDLNPMAVELAKVSLWLTTLAGDKPLTFLDAHLRCGNSLIGAPLRAWTNASGARHYTIDTIHPEANKRLQKGRGGFGGRRPSAKTTSAAPALWPDEAIHATVDPLAGRLIWIAEKPSDTVDDVHDKEQMFRHEVEGDAKRAQLKAVCDLWVASWFWPTLPPTSKAITPDDATPDDATPDDANGANLPSPPGGGAGGGGSLPLDGPIYRQLAEDLSGRRLSHMGINLAPYRAELKRITQAVRPFHWQLEFPEVFFPAALPQTVGAEPADAIAPGFDAVLGNPPWDIVKPNSREFFSAYDPAFRELERVAAQRRQDDLLREPEITDAWHAHEADLTSQVDFYSRSELYPYQSVKINNKQTGGDANTYKLFLERAYQLLASHGRAGQIVKAGIYKDEGSTGLRRLILEQGKLDFLYALSNERWVFPAVHHAERFAVVGFVKSVRADVTYVSFAITPREAISPQALPTYFNAAGRLLCVPTALIRRLSPDTFSLMEFRSPTDVDVIERIYGAWPLLGEQRADAWNVEFAREFDMTNDRDLFNEEGRGWPLYEGKLIHQYTHRWEQPRYWVEPERGRAELARQEIARVEEALADAAKDAGLLPKYSVTRTERVTELLARLGRGPLTPADVRIAPEAYRLAFRAIAANTNERTMIATFLPTQVFFGHSLFASVPWRFDVQAALANPRELATAFYPALPTTVSAYLCGVLNSFITDYALRFKVSSNISMFYVYQLPVPRLRADDPRLLAIAGRVGRLVCVGPEFDGLWRELLGSVEAPVATDEAERQVLKNEIDALVARLYGLSEDDLAHILYAPYTFPLVSGAIKDGVMAAFGRLRSAVQK